MCQVAGGKGGGEFVGWKRSAAGGRAFNCDDHEGWAVEDGAERLADRIGGRVGKGFDVVERAILEDRDRTCVVDGIGNKRFELRKARRVVVAYEFMDQDNLAVDLGRESVRLREKLVFRVVFY